MTTDENDDLPSDRELEIIRRSHRRKMAWISLFFLIGMSVSLLFFVDIETLKSLGNMTDWIYITFGSIVGVYMGSDTFEKIGIVKK